MPCPHASGGRDDDGDDSEGVLSRRQMIRAAVAVGGTGGLSACLDREADSGGPGTDTAASTPTATEQSFPTGPDDLGTLPERQHAWVESLVRDRFGNTALPQHQAMLLLEYTGPEPPTETARKRVEDAFRSLEAAFQRGTGGDSSAVQHEGLLFVVGYAPRYFRRVGGAMPSGVDLRTPQAVLDELGETDPTADEYDAVIHLASGYGSVLLAAERALFGDLDELNGQPVIGGLDGIFGVADRRTGFIGKGQPARKYDVEAIPDSAPLSMGFKSGFLDNLPHEDRVTIQSGPFAGGTTMLVSRIETDLDEWYDHDHGERVERMFSPDHDSGQVGEIGTDLASSSGLSQETIESAEADARERDLVGHGQKIAHARDDQQRQPILRRDFNPTDTPGLHFDSWQRSIEDFLDVRRAMNGEHIESDVADTADGIRSFIEVTNRATFLMPPRSMRALPDPDP